MHACTVAYLQYNLLLKFARYDCNVAELNMHVVKQILKASCFYVLYPRRKLSVTVIDNEWSMDYEYEMKAFEILLTV